MATNTSGRMVQSADDFIKRYKAGESQPVNNAVKTVDRDGGEKQSAVDFIEQYRQRQAEQERRKAMAQQERRTEQEYAQPSEITPKDRQRTYTRNAKRIAELEKRIGEERAEAAKRYAASAAPWKNYKDSYTNKSIEEAIRERDVLVAANRSYERTQKAAAYDPYKKEKRFEETAAAGAARKNATLQDVYEYNQKHAAGEDFDTAAPVIANQLEYYLQNREQAGAETFDRTIMKGDAANWKYIAPEERKMYNYLLQSRGEAAADKYLDDISSLLDERSVNATAQAAAQQAREHRVAANLMSVPVNVVGGAINAAAQTAGAINSGFTGNSWSPYLGAEMAQYGGSVREATAEDIMQSVGEKHPKLGKLAASSYQAVMSGIDSAVGALVFGKGYTPIMGMGAASQRARELYEKGASEGEIAIGAVATGLIEWATEKYSVEYFTEEFLQGNIKGFRDWMKKTAIQAFNEGSEEVASELANMAVDAMLMGVNSENQQEIREMMLNGATEEEAKKSAFLNRANDVLWALYGGAVSGGAMGGFAGGVNLAKDKVSNRMFYNDRGRNAIRNGTGQRIMDDAKAAHADVRDKTWKRAGEAAQLTNEQFEDMSRKERRQAAYALGKVYEATTDTQAKAAENAKKEAFRGAALKMLEGQGVKNAFGAADVLTKAVYEGRLTGGESRIYDSVGGNEIVSAILNNQELRQEAQAATDEKVEQLRSTWNQAADESSEYNPANVRQRLEDAAEGFAGRQAMLDNWQEGQEPEEYARAFEAAYEMGREGIDTKYLKDSISAQMLTEEQRQAAYEAGRNENGTAENDGVRPGTEWNDRADAGGPARSMEGGAGDTAEAEPGTGGEAGGTAAGKGGEVSAKELGIRGGSEKQTLRVRKESEYDDHDRAAQSYARENGLKLVLVEGDSIYTKEKKNGPWIKARAVIQGDTMWVRADDGEFFTDQVTRHEAGHRQLKQKTISRETVRQELARKYTTEQIRNMVNLYASAYSDSGMSPEQIMDEIICDSLGNMNAFATEGTKDMAGDVGLFLRDVRRAADNAAQGGQPVAVTEEAEPGMKARPEGYDELTELLNARDAAYENGDGSEHSREMQTMADLKAENRYLKERVDFWRKEAHRTEKATANRDDVRAAARQLLNAYGSKSDVNQTAHLLQELADYIVSNNGGEGIDFDSAKEMAEDAARLILGGATENVNEVTEDIWKDLKHTLRTTKIEVTDQIKQGMADFDDFRKRNRYQMHFRSKGDGGTRIDTLWMELQGMYGEGLFPDDIVNPADQLMELENLLTRLAPDMQNPYRHQWQLSVQQVQNDILDTLLSDEVRQSGKTRLDKAVEAAEDRAYARAREAADIEWEETVDMLVTARTQDMADRLARKEYRDEQRLQRTEDTIRRNADARVAAEEERYKQKEARMREDFDSRDARRDQRLRNREAALEQRYQEKEARLEAKEDRREARVERIFEGQRQRTRDRIERSRQTEARQKILNVSKTLQNMASGKGKGATQHAPAGMIRGLAEVCQLFEESQLRGAEGYSDKLNERMATLKESAQQGITPELLEEAAKLNRLVDRNERAKGKLADAVAEYAKMADDAESGYNEEIHKGLMELQAMLHDTSIRELSSTQLEQIYDVMKGLVYTVKTANNAFSMGENARKTEIANRFGTQVREVNTTAHGFRAFVQRNMLWHMNPDTAFNAFCGFAKGNEGVKIQKAFSNGTQRMLEVQREYAELMRPLADSAAVRKMMGDPLAKDSMCAYGLLDGNGNEIKTSRGMMLQVYMLLMQEDSFRSLVYGGFRIPNSEVYYDGNASAAYGNGEDGTLHSMTLGTDYQQLVEERKRLAKELDTLGEDATQEDKDRIFGRLAELREEAAPLVAGNEMRLREVLNNIEKQLTETDRRCIEAARKWYKRSGQLMADTYEKMNGFRPKLVDGYVPIHRDPNALQLDIRTEQDVDKAFNLEGSGFTKERVRSTSPILLTDFWQELDQQQSRIGRYVGFAQVQKDFNSIWKMQVDGRTINEWIVQKFGAGDSKFGVSGEQYITNYIKSVAGGASERGVLDRIYQNYAGATLRLNPRVAVSQLASIPTAAAAVGWDNMAKGFVRGLSISMSTDKKNQLARDSVWFYQRYRGAGGATEASDFHRRNSAVERACNTEWGKRLTNWCQEMDVFATASMWCMAEEAVQQRGIHPEDEGYKAAVEECYTDIIRKTQPNYTATERADVLRDQRAGMKMFNMFRTQSVQNLNILMTANAEYIKYRQDYKNGRNGVTKADVQQKTKQLANAYTSVVIGGTMGFVLLRTLVNFALGNVKPYKDKDTGEIDAGEVSKEVLKEMGSSMAGMLTGGSQIYDAVWAVVSRENFYGMSDGAVGAIAEASENFVKLAQAAVDPDKDTTVAQWRKVIQSTGSLFGVPVANAWKFWDAAKMWYTDISQGTLGSFTTGTESKQQHQNRYLEAWKAKDEEKMARAYTALLAATGEETDRAAAKKVASEFAAMLKDRYLDGELTDSEAEKVLAEIGIADPEGKVLSWDVGLIADSWEDGERDAESTVLKLKALGMQTADAISKVTSFVKNDWANERITAAEAIEQLKAAGNREAEATVAGWAADILKDDWQRGKLTEREAARKMVAAGMRAEDAADKVAGWIKSAWKDGKLGDSTCAAKLRAAGMKSDDIDTTMNSWKKERIKQQWTAGDITKSKAIRQLKAAGDENAEDTVLRWEFNDEYEEYRDRNFGASTIRKIMDAAGSGLSVSEVIRVRDRTEAMESDKDAKGKSVSGSLKKKVVAYIESLSVTHAQKKALWQACKGSSWSDKGTPWA